jgi:hypothetical protein
MEYRAQRNIRSLMWVSGTIALLSLAMVITSASLLALVGVGIGWLTGQVIGAAFAVMRRRSDASAAATRL